MEKRSFVFILVLSMAVVFSMASNCPAPFCGDSVLEEYLGEECDPGTPGSGWAETPDDDACPGQCSIDCKCPPPPDPICGDNKVNRPEEVCDGTDDEACPGMCTAECICPPPDPICGDNKVNRPEEVCDGTDDETCPGMCTAECICPPMGGEGCTPGYWKQIQHFGSWTAPYAPGMEFDDVFENAFPGKTLLQVLWQGGGGLKALGRHTVAALLNAASADVEYDMSVEDVIAAFNAVYPGGDYESLKNELADFNEQGCPLGRALMLQ